MKPILEVNQSVEEVQRAADGSNLAGGRVLITPPVGEDFWLMRVKLTDTQAIVAFPKFTTIGIGFQKEEDWNTNLPYRCGTLEIWNHIKHNKGDKRITKPQGMAAIKLIQDECHRLRGTDPVKDLIV